MSIIQIDLARIQEPIARTVADFHAEYSHQLNGPPAYFDKELREEIYSIHNDGMRIASAHRRCEYEMACILVKLHLTKGYIIFKAESLSQYVVCLWQLPANAASDLVTVAKKAAEIPEMLEALRLGKGTVSKLRKVCPIITPENQKQWLALVAECPARTIERCVAMAKPDETEIESAKYKTGSTIQLTVDIPEDLWLELKYTRDLLSQKRQGHVKLSQAMKYLTELGLETLDPIRKARKANERKEKREAKEKAQQTKADQLQELPVMMPSTNTLATGDAPGEPTDDTPVVTCRHQEAGASPKTNSSSRARKKLRADTLHALNLRDGNQCTEIRADGTRCENRRYLHHHHVVPVSHGGSDDVGNLRTICSAHHRAHHLLENVSVNLVT